MHQSRRELFLDEKLRTGGFYELCIQVCPSLDNNPIKLYSDFFWSLEKIEGPFDNNFNEKIVNPMNWVHNGILNFDNDSIPFHIFNIKEDEPLETGFNWFNISIYTSAIEAVFGSKYKTWFESPISPKPISDFFIQTLKQLYKIYPFQLAFIDFEGSGQYYLNDLKRHLIIRPSVKFYVGQDNIEFVANENKNAVTIID